MKQMTEAELRKLLEDSYEIGYGAGQTNPNGYSDQQTRDAEIALMLAEV